jgi:hypothetical protein
MQVDMTLEYRCWDNTESITIEQVTRGGMRKIAVDVAKGRNIRGREKSPSGGVYVGYERNWHIPRVLLPEGAELKAADIVVDEGGKRDTVLTANYNRHKQRWELGCVDLVLALDLRDQVVIQRAAIGYDPAGVPVKTFPPGGGSVLFTRPARVQPMTQEIAEERGVRFAKDQYDIVVGGQIEGVDSSQDRVVWRDRQGQTWTLDIVSVHNAERIDELPVIVAERRL